MPLKMEQPIIVSVTLEDGDALTFEFPAHGDAEFEKAKKRMRDTRSVQKGRKQVSQSAEVRCKLFDRFATNPTGPVDLPGGRTVDLSEVENWKAKFPSELKESVISQNFEETVTEEVEEDLDEASGDQPDSAS